MTLYDSHEVELRDLGAQFYLAESDVGSNRAEACHAKLQELNTAVTVSTLHTELSADQLSKFDVRTSLLASYYLFNCIRGPLIKWHTLSGDYRLWCWLMPC